jgi:MFS family permease
MDSLGRRKTIMLGAMINLVGAILQCAAQNLAMVLVGRIFAGWAVGVLSMSVPIYQSECAHPKTRGTPRIVTTHFYHADSRKVSLLASPSK